MYFIENVTGNELVLEKSKITQTSLILNILKTMFYLNNFVKTILYLCEKETLPSHSHLNWGRKFICSKTVY